MMDCKIKGLPICSNKLISRVPITPATLSIMSPPSPTTKTDVISALINTKVKITISLEYEIEL